MHTTPHPADATAAVSPAANASSTLTIDTEHLRDLFLPVERDAAASAALMRDLTRRASQGRNTHRFLAIARAQRAMQAEWHGTVENVRDRGGLLHIGCAP